MPAPFPELLANLLSHARMAGADSADALVAESRSVQTALRQGALTDLERSETAEIGLRVLVGQQQASLASTDLNPKHFATLAEKAVSMAKSAPADPYAGLPDKAMLATRFPDLDLHDGNERPAESLIEAAREMDALARANPDISNVEEASASTGFGLFHYAATNGFSGGYRSSSHGISLVTIAGKDTTMVRDYGFSSAIHASDLRSPASVASEAIERTISRLGARKMPTGAVPVVFAPRIARSLVSTLLSAITGTAIARKSSFLIDALNTEIFSKAVTIVDDPHMKRGLRSKPFDGEGLACTRRSIIDQGRLTTWLLNTASAKQLGLHSTGHATRGAGGVPGIGANNVAMLAGTLSPQDLIGDIQSGFYVTETMGFGVNTLTGDYSQGAAGFWIEKGQIAFPVHEMTIAGNLASMFKALIPANDLEYRYGIDAPTVRIDGMMVAGA